MYEPQDPVETIRTNFGSQSGHLEYLQITFWNLTLLTETPMAHQACFGDKKNETGVFYLHVDTCDPQNRTKFKQ